MNLPESLLGIDTTLAAVVLGAAGLLLAGIVVWRRRGGERRADTVVPLLFFPPGAGAGLGRMSAAGPESSEEGVDDAAFDDSPLEEAAARRPAPHLRVLSTRSVPVEPKRAAPRESGNLAPAYREEVAAELAPSLDGTLQLLPGRLEPLSGEGGQEIRFVKVPGGVNRFTLGRSAGPTHTHIQLNAATASRMHACMVFEHGRWQIGNLSATNPVVVNGQPLPLDGVEQRLEDGDRIELGELVFLFRGR